MVLLDSQRPILAKLRVPPLFQGIRRSMKYWDISRDPDELAENTIANLVIAATRLPAGVVVSALKTLCNAWPTATRFHHKRHQMKGGGACLFSGLPRFDRVMHYLSCPVLRDGWRRAAGHIRIPNGRQDTIETFCLSKKMTEEECCITCIINDAFLKAFNCVRTGANPNRAEFLIKSRLRFWSMRSNNKYGSFLRGWIGRARANSSLQGGM